MRLLRVWLLLAPLALLAGCFPAIYSQEPLGEVGALKPEEWNGSWLAAHDASVEMFWVIDADKGILTNGYSCQPPSADAQDKEWIQLRRSGEGKWYFPISGKRGAQGEFIPNQGPPFSYTFLFHRPNANSWYWYMVAEDRFKSLIEQGALPGRVEDESPILGHLGPEHYTVLASEERPVVQWQNPAVFVKLPPQLDPCRKGEQGIR